MFKTVSKLLLLSFIYFILRSIIFAGLVQQVFSLPMPELDNPGSVMLFNFFVSIIFTVIIFPLRSSRSAMYSVLIGIPVIINQIETFFFEGSVTMSVKELLSYSLGNILAALFLILIYTMFFKSSKTRESRVVRAKSLIIPVLIYPVIYLFFGSLLFLYSPAKEYYSSIGTPSMISILVFQLFRGVLWLIPSVLIRKTVKFPRKTTALYMGILYASLMSLEILVPVDFMPINIKLAHFVELFGSHLVWGIIMGSKNTTLVSYHFPTKSLKLITD